MRCADQDKAAGDISVPESEAAGEGAAFMVLSNENSPLNKYPDIVDVQQGNCNPELLDIGRSDLLILGKTGGRTCDFYQNIVLKNHPSITDFAHIYGVLPVGQAFDLAIGALMLRNRGIQLKSEVSVQAGTRINHPPKSAFSRVFCLTINPGGEYGLVAVAGNQKIQN